MAEPPLLRKPLPPKPEKDISRIKGLKEDLEATKFKEKHKEDDIQDLVPVKSIPYFPGIDLGKQVLDLMPSHVPPPYIKRNVHIAPQFSGPASFPSLKNYTPVRMKLLSWKEYPLHMESKLELRGFTTANPLAFPMVELLPPKPISTSRRNYKAITNEIIEEQTRGPQYVSTFLFHFGDLFHPTLPRRPQQQIMIERMLEEKAAISLMSFQESEESKEEERILVKSKTREPKRIVSFREQLISGVQCKPQLTEEDEEKEQISKAEMAVLMCLLPKKTGLSLKAYFLTQLPGLSSLSDFLVYLNLSFNCLSVFPNEVFCLKHLEILKLRNNPISSIPEDIKQMESLKVLIMSFNMLTILPPWLFELPNLEGLDVSYNELESVSDDIGNLSQLTYLNLEGNFLKVLPCGILKLPLSQLKVENNFLHPYLWCEIPQLEIQPLSELAALCFSRKNLESVYGKLRRNIQKILDNYSSCRCCQGKMFGEGFRFVRIYRNAYGLRLPYLFRACSTACYTNFTSQTNPA